MKTNGVANATRFFLPLICLVTGHVAVVTAQNEPPPSPPCLLLGPNVVCAGTSNLFDLRTDAIAPGAVYTWDLTNNTSGAYLLAPCTGPSIQVASGENGTFSLVVTVATGAVQHTCALEVRVETGGTSATPLADQSACTTGTATFSTTPSGTGLFRFAWRKGEVLITGATNASLTLTNLTPDDAGRYCVEVSGPCGTVARCADLAVDPPPTLFCPENLVVACLNDVPPPDPVRVACFGPTRVTHVGDTMITNRDGIVITRLYRGTDACGNEAFCHHLINVCDITPPVVTCATDRIVECGTPWAFDLPTAFDLCDGTNVAISVVGTITNSSPPGYFSVTRTWSAADAVGNKAECRQTITVADRMPPQIVCPADFTVMENPPGSGSAVVTYPAPAVADNCDANPLVAFDPPSGSMLTAGNHLVVGTVRDEAGNTNACSFDVRVLTQTIVVISTADSGPGTIRQALLDANAMPGTNVITFALEGGSPYVIHLLSPLPFITDPVVIDAWSQLEFRGDPIIQLDGSTASGGTADFVPASVNPTGSVDGLVITSGGSTVRGLVLNGFAVGIRLEGSGDNVLQGNFIGTDLTGTLGIGNAGDGILVHSPRNLIGGALPAARNLISRNRGSGIRLEGTNAANNVVRRNWIGTGNNGTSPLGNSLDGVTLAFGAANNVVGGTMPGAGNIIAYNHRNGIALDSTAGSGNALRGNSISANGSLGIDLGADGTTANDAADMDSGPNNQQNFPLLSGASSDGSMTTVRGTLSSAPNATYQLDFFVRGVSNGSSQTFLGSSEVVTDPNGNQPFTATFPTPTFLGQFITATATDAANNTSEYSPEVPVGGPLVILAQPTGTNVPPGTPVTFCVSAGGSPPLTYQWRLNGANIDGATNACFTIPAAQLTDGGAYTVIVANDFDAIASDTALLVLVLPARPGGDNFADRVPLTNVTGIIAGNSGFATRETGEPFHAGKQGGKSVWYTWTAPAAGIATFSTAGSTFDTLLAVYNGTTVSNLTVVAGDEDGGGFYTSGVRYNTTAGTQYRIALDGFGGAGGNFVLSWTFEATTQLLPVITNQPVSQTVAPGATAKFTVGVLGPTNTVACHQECCWCNPSHSHDGEDVDDWDLRRILCWVLWWIHDRYHDCPDVRVVATYQWYLNGVAIRGATNSMLTVTNVQDADLGYYTVQVQSEGRIVESVPANLQINLTGSEAQSVQAWDKFLDAVDSNPLRLGNAPPSPPANANPGGGFQAAATVVRGYTGAHVFSTVGAKTEAGEGPICGVNGGASEWIAFIAEETGILALNTDGSTYDTVVAILTRIPNSPMLMILGCDNNSGMDNQDSAVMVPVEVGRTNFIVVDGVNGASGSLHLNYTLFTPTYLTPLGTAPDGSARLRIAGRPGLRFTLQRSPDLQAWSPIMTTNAPTGMLDLIDTDPATMPGRFYRALLLP